MKHAHTSHRRAIGLLLAAVALPLTPVLAQDTSTAPEAPSAQPPVVQVEPAAPAPAPAPIIAPPAPPEAAAPAAAEPAPALEPVAQEARSAPPRRAPSASRRVATPSLSTAPAPAARAVTPVEPALPSPTASPVTDTTAPPVAPAETIAPPPQAAATTVTPAQSERSPIWPWLVGALVLIGAAAFLLRRRRTTFESDDVIYSDEQAYAAPPVMGTQIAEPSYVAAAAPLVAEEPEIAAPVDEGRPSISLQMRPVRAGVNDEDAIVEFELTVDNQGTAPARDLRISTWMFAAGHASEAERALIEPSGDYPEVTIASGHAKRIESAVALPTAGFREDAMLPVVVAEARYTLPDGSEEHATAAFEVGVPIGEELAHFSLDNPSGLHDDVVARPHADPVQS